MAAAEVSDSLPQGFVLDGVPEGFELEQPEGQKTKADELVRAPGGAVLRIKTIDGAPVPENVPELKASDLPEPGPLSDDTKRRANAVKASVIDGSMSREQGARALGTVLGVQDPEAFLSQPGGYTIGKEGFFEAIPKAALQATAEIGNAALNLVRPEAYAIDQIRGDTKASEGFNKFRRDALKRQEEAFGSGEKAPSVSGRVVGGAGAIIPVAIATGGAGLAADAALGARLLSAARGAASFAVPAGINRSGDLVDDGVPLPEALTAGAVTAAGNEALGLLPAGLGRLGPAASSLAGGVARRATGAAAGFGAQLAGNEALRRTENAFLPADHQQAAPDLETALIQAAPGAAFGALHTQGRSGSKAALSATFDDLAPLLKEVDVGGETQLVAPNGALLGTKEQARENFENASPRVRAGYLKTTEAAEPKVEATAKAVDDTQAQWLVDNGFQADESGRLLDRDGEAIEGPRLEQVQQHLAQANDAAARVVASGREPTADSIREDLRHTQRLGDLQSDLTTAQTPAGKAVVQKRIDALQAGRAERAQAAVNNERRQREADDLRSLAAQAADRGDAEARAAYIAEADAIAKPAEPQAEGVAVRAVEPEKAIAADPPPEPSPGEGIEVVDQPADEITLTDPNLPAVDPHPGIEVGDLPALNAPPAGFVVDESGNAFGARTESNVIDARARRAPARKALPLISDEEHAVATKAGNIHPENVDRQAIASLAHLIENEPETAQRLLDENHSTTALAAAIHAHTEQAGTDGARRGEAPPGSEAGKQGKPEQTGSDVLVKSKAEVAAKRAAELANRSKTRARRLAELKPSAEKDDVITFLRKHGGINLDQPGGAEIKGRLKHLEGFEPKIFGLPGIERRGVDKRTGKHLGLTLEEATEIATDGGYIESSAQGYDQAALLDLLFNAEDGKPRYSIKNETHVEDAILRELEESDAREAGRKARLLSDDLDPFAPENIDSVLQAHDLGDEPDTRAEVDFVARATDRLGEDAVSRLAEIHESDDDFHAALQEALDEHAKNQNSRSRVRAGEDAEAGPDQSEVELSRDRADRSTADLFGRNESAQAVADRAREKDKARNGTKEIPADRDGGLFSDEAKQTDIADGVERAQRLVDQATKEWKNKPDVTILNGLQDPTAPAAARREDAAQKSRGATGEVLGFIHGGKVYINAEAARSPKAIVETLYHESLGHYGLRGVFGDALSDELKKVALLRPADIKAKLAEYGLAETPSNRLRAAEEVLARMAQMHPELPVVKRTIAAIRNAIRPALEGLGIKLKLTDNDIIQKYLLPARRFVKDGGETRGGGLAFHRTDDESSEHLDAGDVELFHGGNRDLKKISGAIGPGNIFGGIFASHRLSSAESHGDGSIFKMRLKQDRILTQEKIDDIPEETVREALRKVAPWVHEGDANILHRAVAEDKSHKVDDDDLTRVFREDTVGEASFEAQRLRGALAKELGFKAVEMSDEHGTSYLVLPGTELLQKDGTAVTKSERAEAINQAQDGDGVDFNRQQIETPEFKKFFEGSKVVDEAGEPLVVYHGTSAAFDSFDPKKIGSNYKQDRKGFFFTSRPKEAEYAADDAAEKSGAANIIPVYVSLKNPLDIDVPAGKGFSASGWLDNAKKGVVARAKIEARDGIIVRGIGDDVVFVAFKPSQIKSAIGNRGTFDSESDRIDFRRGGATVNTPAPQGAKARKALSVGVEERKSNFGKLFSDPAAVKRFVRNSIGDNLGELFDRQAAVEKTRKLADNENPHDTEIASHGRIRNQVEDLQKKYFEPALSTLKGTEITAQDFADFLYARHAPERNAFHSRDGISGLTDAQARNLIAGFSPAERATLEKAAGYVDALHNSKLDTLVDAGVISADARTRLKAAYKHYVPLKTVESESHLGVNLSSNTTLSPISRVKGRTTAATDPLSVSVRDAVAAIVVAEQNKVRQAAVKFVENNPAPDAYEIVPPNKLPRKDDGSVDYESIKNNKKLFGAKFDGQDKIFRIHDEDLARQLHGYARTHPLPYGAEHVLRAVGAGTRVLSTLYTTLSLNFVLKNAARDVQHALSISSGLDVPDPAGFSKRLAKALPGAYKEGLRHFVGELRGIEPKGKDADLYRQFKADGGTTGGYGLTDVETIAKRATDLVAAAQGNKVALAKNIALKPLQIIEGFNNVFENAARYAAYKSALENGLTRQKAAVLAKNITVNFDKKGESTRIFNSIYAFFNASVQGVRGIISAAPKSRVVQAALGTYFVAGILNEILPSEVDEDGNKKIDYLSAFKRDSNVVVPLGNDRFATVPVAQGFNVPFYAGRHLVRLIRGDETPGKAASGFLAAAMRSYLPLSGNNPIDAVTPTLIKPYADVDKNKSFSDSKIYPDERKDRPLSQQHFAGANEVFEDMAKALYAGTGADVHGASIEYVMKGYLGGPFKTLSDLLTLARGEAKAEDIPVASGFLAEKNPAFNERNADKIVREIEARKTAIAKDGAAPKKGEAILIATIRGIDSDVDRIEKAKTNLLKGNPKADTKRLDDALAQKRKSIAKFYNDWKSKQDEK